MLDTSDEAIMSRVRDFKARLDASPLLSDEEREMLGAAMALSWNCLMMCFSPEESQRETEAMERLAPLAENFSDAATAAGHTH